MISSYISTLKFIFKRFFNLGGWNLISAFFSFIRQHGLIAALKRSWQILFWEHGANYIKQAQVWYDKNDCLIIKGAAKDLLSKPNVLIIGSIDLPQCKKYRVMQKVEFFKSMGVSCEISSYHNIPRAMNKIQLATLVIFYRVPDGELFSLFLTEAKRLNVRIGYDIDDPIFAPEVYAENKNLDMLTENENEKKQLLDSAKLFRNAMMHCDFVSVSTPEMFELVRTFFNGEIILWRNVLDSESLSIVEQCRKSLVHKNEHRDSIVIAYMSGSRAHDADFASIEKVLSKILEDFQNVNILIGGYAEIPKELHQYEDRIKRFPFQGYAKYFEQLIQADISIIPLLQDQFNNCKSAIRFLESSAVGVPTIVSNIGDFRNLIVNNKNGILADSLEEWDSSLRKLIKSRELRGRLSENAKQFVMEKQTIEYLSHSLKNDLSIILHNTII